MNRIRLSLLLALALPLTACAGDEPPYDPDADAELAISGGKADGIYDIIPEIAFDTNETGSITGDDVEFYRIDLQRTDSVTVEMEATAGDLNPHLSFYYGANTYVSSDTWDRSGDTITKTYTAESAGTYLIAARVYRQSTRGGDYRVRITCSDGPCAGNFPDPVDFYDTSTVGECFTEAYDCALAALPRYDGRVGAARANLIMQECMATTSTGEGDSCASVCDWVNPEDRFDTGASACDALVSYLPWFADASDECMGEYDSCISDCIDLGDYSEGFYDQALPTCINSGLNGDCPSYVRELEVCGGELIAESSGQCELHCLSTSGAFTDDTQDLCGRDAGCDYGCEIDIEAAGVACGGVTEANERCLNEWLGDHWAYACENALIEILRPEE